MAKLAMTLAYAPKEGNKPHQEFYVLSKFVKTKKKYFISIYLQKFGAW